VCTFAPTSMFSSVLIRSARPSWGRCLQQRAAVAQVRCNVTPAAPAVAPRTHFDELTSLTVQLAADKPGTLMPLLGAFSRHNLNVTHLTSKLHQYSFGGAMFELDFEGGINDESTQACLKEINEMPDVRKVIHVPCREVPWFPTSLLELDDARTTLDGGTALISEDHPGFKDMDYRQRRDKITENARDHQFGQPIPTVDYTEDEHATWTKVYDRLQNLQQKYACKDFQQAMHSFNKQGVLTRDRIPQLVEVSEILRSHTGFQLRPVMGLLSARDFLNALAFRVFWSTQYIRHHSNPYYTPEPDVCHELLGHVPLFANPDFAEFSQTIGLASLGASDEQIDKLATLYWFTVEFGVLGSEEEGYTAYGAGVLSSFGELEWACSPTPSDACRQSGGLTAFDAFKDLKRPKMVPLVAEVASETAFPITTFQPQYFVSPTMGEAKQELLRFCDTLTRPFFCRYDPFSQRIKVTRAIERMSASTTVDMQAIKQLDYFENLKAGSYS